MDTIECERVNRLNQETLQNVGEHLDAVDELAEKLLIAAFSNQLFPEDFEAAVMRARSLAAWFVTIKKRKRQEAVQYFD